MEERSLKSQKEYNKFAIENGLGNIDGFVGLGKSQNFLEKYRNSLLANLSEKKEELIIQSDKQSEIDNVIYSEGNVFVSYRGKHLKADNLIYDKLNKEISAKGNITLILGDQIFKASQLEYSFVSDKGYLLDVNGFINTNSLMDDLSSNFSSSDSKKLENFRLAIKSLPGQA